jgi:alanyl-tRNA synthetase
LTAQPPQNNGYGVTCSPNQYPQFRMNSRQVRQLFFDYFRRQGHEIYPSAPIVNKDDPTLLFTNAGMNQFKDLFTGDKPATHPRVANTQKCLRVSGKHNDLEEVGYDTYHHTMFEMLGNWSFGDYFKDVAIPLAWKFITEECGIDPSLLYVTVFEGDEANGLPRDMESVAVWKQFLPEDRILFFSAKDNFWEMGDTGPCGPCTEIHIDLRSAADKAQLPGAQVVNTGHSEVIEIWNVVFIQFNRKLDGKLDPLPLKSVDTGMGFERLNMVLQGVTSTYDTDVFTPIRKHLEALTGLVYGKDKMTDVALRVAMDHIRAITFTIADGQLPSNTGAGYVVRRLIRRASRYGFQYLGLREPFLWNLVPLLAEQFQGVFNEVASQQGFIQQVLRQEEANFLQTLERGTRRFEEYMAAQDSDTRVINGAFAFELYDTYGFPPDLTRLMATESGWTMDEEGFDAQMAAQRARSQAAAAQETGDWVELQPASLPLFLGYETLTLEAEVVKYRRIRTKKGDQYQLVLDRTPFYAESGGQVGDTGWLAQAGQRIRVLDTKKENDLIVHWVESLPSDLGGSWVATVDAPRRAAIRANHSATHLLHAALRSVLGAHVEQRGSLVGPDYLRFDFSHFNRMTEDELARVEALVNEKIAEQLPLEELRDVPLDDAKAMGAMALFGEKYGDRVRVIRFGGSYSTELCGGTHVRNTSDIRVFKITSEGSVAAGVRRIEAVTGSAALAWFGQQVELLAQVRDAMRNPKDLVQAINALQEQNKELQKTLDSLVDQVLEQQADALAATATLSPGGIAFLVQRVDVPTADAFKRLGGILRRRVPRSVVVLGAIVADKPQISVSISDDLAGQPHLNAQVLIKPLAAHIQGGGGGQAVAASAGGKNKEGLELALQEARSWVSAY